MARPDAPGVRERLARLVARVPLDAADEARYQDERVASNRRSVRAVGLALIPCHPLSLALYWPANGPFAGDFHTTVFLLNLLAIPVAAGFAALVTFVEPRWSPWGWRGWASDLFALTYVLLTAGMSVNAQRLNGNINVY